MTTPIDDPMESAVEAAERPPTLWGKLEVSAQYVVLVKGTRPVAYDPNIHSQDKRVTQVHISINPLDQTNQTRISERRMMAEFGEFPKIVWPSARALGAKSLRDLHGKWAKVELAKTGSTYETKRGEVRDEVTYKFVALFASETEAVAAFQSGVPGGAETGESGQSATVEAHSSPAMDEKATSAQFLPHLVKAANGDLTKLAQSLASMAPLNKYFTVESPEVQALLKVTA